MPLSPSFSNTRFTNPWSNPSRTTPSAFTTRPARSPSASSTTSTSSFYSTTSSFAGLDSMLASGNPAHTRSSSITSLSSSGNSSRRPSCFSIIEAEEERAEFGEAKISLLEPRNSVGWWGMRQILEESVEERL